MVLLLPCAWTMKAVKRNINAYHLFRKTTKTLRQDLLLTSHHFSMEKMVF